MIVGGVVLVAAAAAVVAVVLWWPGGESDGRHTLRGPSSDPFTIAYPDGWRPLDTEQLAAQPGDPLAVLRRDDGAGTLVVEREKPAPDDLQALATDTRRQFAERFDDFREERSRVVQVRAGRALLFSYVREKRRTAHAVVVVPAGDHSYTLNTVVPLGNAESADQLAAMASSFDLPHR